MESATLLLHIAAGGLAIIAGGVAVFAAKGAALHRQSGLIFVYAMVVMGVTGFAIAIVRDLGGSISGGPLAAYLVITALTTVRPISRKLDIAMLLVALSIAGNCLALAVNALASGRTAIDDVPVPMILLFGTIALLSGISDARLIHAGGIHGRRRITRHLWRMCFAFWVATGSFFLGQMDEFPAVLQNGALMSIPAFFPLAVMMYWLWRVRIRRLTAGLTLRQASRNPGLRRPVPYSAGQAEIGAQVIGDELADPGFEPALRP